MKRIQLADYTIPDDLSIPDFLKVTPEEAERRKRWWEANPPRAVPAEKLAPLSVPKPHVPMPDNVKTMLRERARAKKAEKDEMRAVRERAAREHRKRRR